MGLPVGHMMGQQQELIHLIKENAFIAGGTAILSELKIINYTPFQSIAKYLNEFVAPLGWCFNVICW